MTQERDLRSLNRRSMYSIFAPLDADERLPRELLMEARRAKQLGRRELAGALWLPLLAVILTVAAWGKMAPLPAAGMIAAGFGGLCAFVLLGKRAPK
ncbi:MAG: hypothetical protein ABI334_01030 [Candidatus Dormiibacterota bacterium]